MNPWGLAWQPFCLLLLTLHICNNNAANLVTLTTESPDVDVECHLLLEKFSNSSAYFTRCAADHAKPISMCRECLRDLLETTKYYESLSFASEGGVICKDIFTSQDRVEIISQTFHFVAGDQGLWSQAHCSRCYTEPLTDASNLTQETQTFFALYAEVNSCFDDHPVNKTKFRNAACDACNTRYQNMWRFFKDSILGAEYPSLGSTCYDILDAMNVTQKTWGDDYNCGRKLILHVPLLISVIAITATSFLFYLFVYCTGSPVPEPVVPRHNRLLDFLQRLVRRSAAEQPLQEAATGPEDASPGSSITERQASPLRAPVLSCADETSPIRNSSSHHNDQMTVNT